MQNTAWICSIDFEVWSDFMFHSCRSSPNVFVNIALIWWSWLKCTFSSLLLRKVITGVYSSGSHQCTIKNVWGFFSIMNKCQCLFSLNKLKCIPEEHSPVLLILKYMCAYERKPICVVLWYVKIWMNTSSNKSTVTDLQL